MPNIHGALFALRALVKPGLIIPGIRVDSKILHLDYDSLSNRSKLSPGWTLRPSEMQGIQEWYSIETIA